jgi:hypothetical protein
MIINEREQSRRVFCEVWYKSLKGDVMTPLEARVLAVIRQHPEYQPMLTDGLNMDREFTNKDGQANPFLHMGLHIAIIEQVSTDRPPGIASLYRTLLGKYQDEHGLLHRMMGCLEQALWAAQERGQPPDEQAYLASLRGLG